MSGDPTSSRKFRPYLTELSASFDDVADAYDEARPGYPDALCERILAFAGMLGSERVLEVGVGTGKATRLFAVRGHAVYGLEPGARLAEVARARLAAFATVDIETTSFEGWEPAPHRFGLAFCAQAYHWLEPATRVGKFAQALRPGGTLAVFGNVPRVSPGALCEELKVIYAQRAPALFERRGETSWYASAQSPIASELAASPDFSAASFEQFAWSRALSASQYALLLGTYSDHRALPSAQRSSLLAAVSDAITRHGNSVSLEYTAGLFLAWRVS